MKAKHPFATCPSPTRLRLGEAHLGHSAGVATCPGAQAEAEGVGDSSHPDNVCGRSMLTTVQTPLKSIPRVTPYSWPAPSAGRSLRFCPFCCCLAPADFFCGASCRKAAGRQPHDLPINCYRAAEASMHATKVLSGAVDLCMDWSQLGNSLRRATCKERPCGAHSKRSRSGLAPCRPEPGELHMAGHTGEALGRAQCC